jgi:hypothetical protein
MTGEVVRRPTARRGSEAHRASRLLVLSAVFFHLAGTVGAYAHFALVRHRVCPLHGELIDAEGSQSGEPARSSRVADETTYQQGVPRTEHGHDVCALTASLRERAIEPAATGGAQDEPLQSQALACPRADQVVAGRVDYRVAPKTSPPDRV